MPNVSLPNTLTDEQCSALNILKLEFKGNKIETGENTLPVTENNLILPCGIYGKVTKD